MSAWEFVVSLHKWIPFFSRERPGQPASTSEIRRWLQNRAVRINGLNPLPTDEVTFPVTDLVFFPKSDKNRITMV